MTKTVLARMKETNSRIQKKIEELNLGWKTKGKDTIDESVSLQIKLKNIDNQSASSFNLSDSDEGTKQDPELGNFRLTKED